VLQSGALASVGLSATTSNQPNLAISGLASGMDWTTIIQELANAERSPETQWQATQTQENNQNSAYTTISNDLNTLQLDVQTLQDPSLYGSTVASSSDSSVATASAASGTAVGSYVFNISKLATAAQMNGVASISNVLAPGGNVSAVTLGTAGFSTPITAGTITVDGAQVTISQSDSLQQVFSNIASATNNAVTASYDATSDEITLSSSNPITLGSAADTSNFLQVAQLYNNGTNTVTSTSALGRVNTSATMANADLKTAITDGGSGNGEFTINGVTFNYNASTDTIQDVLNNINQSSANVNATYDSVNNRFVLANKTTGDVGVAMQDVTGNFLAASGLSGGTLQRGQNLAYTLNGGSQTLYSQSNTITSASSGIDGLTVTALAENSATVTVSPDTTTISNDIQKFVTDYNTVQSYITSQMAVTQNADGSSTPGLLTGDQTISQVSSSLRSLMTSAVSAAGMDGKVSSLNDLGIESNGNNNTLTISDTTALTSALTNNLSDVKALFSDPSKGLAVQFTTLLTNTIGNNGTIPNHQAVLTQDSANITTQISNLEKQITNDSNKWTTEFQNMETAESQTNQELTYLSQSVSNGSL
jgi:flagellar hook-associated protein 2